MESKAGTWGLWSSSKGAEPQPGAPEVLQEQNPSAPHSPDRGQSRRKPQPPRNTKTPRIFQSTDLPEGRILWELTASSHITPLAAQVWKIHLDGSGRKAWGVPNCAGWCQGGEKHQEKPTATAPFIPITATTPGVNSVQDCQRCSPIMQSLHPAGQTGQEMQTPLAAPFPAPKE